MSTNNFTYKVFYSSEDEVYVAYLENMPSLSVYSDTREQAIKELKDLVEYCYADNKLKSENKFNQAIFA